MKVLSTIISMLVLFLTLTTLIFSVGAYLAFKLKENRKPEVKPHKQRASAPEEAILQPYVLDDKK